MIQRLSDTATFDKSAERASCAVEDNWLPRWCRYRLNRIAFSLAGSLFALVQVGCASLEEGVSNVKAAATAALASSSASQGSRPDSIKAGGINDTELDGLFKRVPITSANHAEQFPRAAITITSATPSIFRAGKFTDQECIRFNVRLWTGAKTSKRFDDLQMCSGDISADVAFSPLRNWPIFHALRNTTGADGRSAAANQELSDGSDSSRCLV